MPASRDDWATAVAHAVHREDAHTAALSVGELTWNDLVDREPLLGDVADEAKSTSDDSPYCQLDTWYRRFKPRVRDLVGWDRGSFGTPRRRLPSIESCTAYDLAYESLYAMLPDCRDCSHAPRGRLHGW